jgi:hypothetical protein
VNALVGKVRMCMAGHASRFATKQLETGSLIRGHGVAITVRESIETGVARGNRTNEVGERVRDLACISPSLPTADPDCHGTRVRKAACRVVARSARECAPSADNRVSKNSARPRSMDARDKGLFDGTAMYLSRPSGIVSEKKAAASMPQR